MKGADPGEIHAFWVGLLSTLCGLGDERVGIKHSLMLVALLLGTECHETTGTTGGWVVVAIHSHGKHWRGCRG